MYTTDYHSAIKKDEILPFIAWTDLESIMLSKKKNQRTQIVYDFIHVEYQKTKKQS